MEQFDPPTAIGFPRRIAFSRGARVDQKPGLGPRGFAERRRRTNQQSQRAALLRGQLPATERRGIERRRPGQHRRHPRTTERLVGRPPREIFTPRADPQHPREPNPQSRGRWRIKRSRGVDHHQPPVRPADLPGDRQGQESGPRAGARGDPLHQRSREETAAGKQGVQLPAAAGNPLPRRFCGPLPAAQLLGQLSHAAAAIVGRSCHDSVASRLVIACIVHRSLGVSKLNFWNRKQALPAG